MDEPEIEGWEAVTVVRPGIPVGGAGGWVATLGGVSERMDGGMDDVFCLGFRGLPEMAAEAGGGDLFERLGVASELISSWSES